MSIFKKKKPGEPDSRIVVLRKPEPGTCGGTTATQDTKAPKEILSTDMRLFEAESALSDCVRDRTEDTIGFFSAYAAPAGEGSFLFLETREYRRGGRQDSRWALVKENVMPALVSLAAELNLAKNNGFHSKTHGLPENFGGSVNIVYGSGERISFSNNQSPIVSVETGKRIVDLFRKAMAGENIPLPDPSGLKEIRFSEERSNGGYTRASLTFLEDGTGVNRKTSRYDGPAVYESEKPVEAETVDAIRKCISETALFAWGDLPQSGYGFENKFLTFVFKDGKELTVQGNKATPGRIRNGFFNVELEMTTKH